MTQTFVIILDVFSPFLVSFFLFFVCFLLILQILCYLTVTLVLLLISLSFYVPLICLLPCNLFCVFSLFLVSFFLFLPLSSLSISSSSSFTSTSSKFSSLHLLLLISLSYYIPLFQSSHRHTRICNQVIQYAFITKNAK